MYRINKIFSLIILSLFLSSCAVNIEQVEYSKVETVEQPEATVSTENVGRLKQPTSTSIERQDENSVDIPIDASGVEIELDFWNYGSGPHIRIAMQQENVPHEAEYCDIYFNDELVEDNYTRINRKTF